MAPVAAANPYHCGDVLIILHERGWLTVSLRSENRPGANVLLSMLGGHAADGAALADLLRLVFYMTRAKSFPGGKPRRASRYAARKWCRQVALMLLDGVR